MPKISEELQATGVSLINEAITQGSLRTLSNILDDDIFDREWVVRNVLGGMAAGFGLRGPHAPRYLPTLSH
jgi:lambda repressor-like predicted transcriptional regulator